MYDGRNSLEQLFATLLSRKYKGYYIFAHNLSRFDGHFITNYLLVLNSLPIVLTGYAITLLNNANIEGQAIVFCNSLLMM